VLTARRARTLPILGTILVAAFVFLPLTGRALYPPDVGRTDTAPGTARRGLQADELPTVRFAAGAYRIDEDAGPAILTVMLDAASDESVTVKVAVGGGTATAGEDYADGTGTLTFAPGQVSQLLSVTVIADALDEDDETAVLALGDPSGATLGTPDTATLTIADDDALPTVGFDRSSYAADEEAGTATITVTLSVPSSRTITVDFETGDGTATAGSDYAATEGTLTFPPPASMTAEATLERLTETSLYDPPSPDPAGVAYVSHLDMLLISDSEVNEITGEPGLWEGANLFATTLSGELIDTYATTGSTWDFSNEPTDVGYNPRNRHLFFSDDDRRRAYEVDPGRDGAYATADDVIRSFRTSDLSSLDPEGVCYETWGGTLLIADGAGERIYRIAPGANGVFDGVPACGGDDQVTYVETHRLNIHDPEGVEFDPHTGHLYISGRRHDPIAETTIDGRLIRYIGISVLAPQKPAGLAYAPSSTGPGAWHLYMVDRGVNDDDDPAENDGRLYEISFPPGETTRTFAVPIVDDSTTEGIETLYLSLEDPAHAVLDPESDHATLAIVDTWPDVQFSTASYEVGEGAGWATITVTLSALSGKTVSVGYATRDGTAVAGRDYVPAAGELTFAAGVTERSFEVTVIADRLDGGDKTLDLALSDPRNVFLGAPSAATLTIMQEIYRMYLPVVWQGE
jgi:hypothetical protein